jgi:hypothetical protein
MEVGMKRFCVLFTLMLILVLGVSSAESAMIIDGQPLVTWDPLTMGSYLTLSNGNLTATTGNGGSWSSVFATAGKATGKWYWEITITADGGFYLSTGVSTRDGLTGSLSNFVGSDTYGYGYVNNNGHKYNNNAGSTYGATYTSGDVIGVAFDADNHTIEFFKNNTSQGVAYTGMIAGTYYPVMSLYTVVSPSAIIVADFGHTSFVYSPPSTFVRIGG